jgi:hypothetical protein
MNGWTWLWVGWLIAFASVEIPAIIRRNNSTDDPDTLSDHLVRWFHIRTTGGKIAWSVFALGGALWLWLHILTEQAV